MKFQQQLALTERRMKQAGDFDARWRLARAQLPEAFSISRLADGSANLYRSQWVSTDNGGASFESTVIFECIERSAQLLGMVCFCKVLRLKGLPLKLAVRMYRVCIPPE